MLNVENLVKDYTTGFLRKKIRVLKGVSFSVNRGEIFGFVGPNGAGKTTTFKTILGFVTPTSGSVEIMGKPLGDVDVKKYIGYLPENPYFYDYLTGEELLHYMGELHGLNGGGLSKRVNELLEKVNMSHAKRVQLRKYSKGMLQRVGVAQALINDPEFLILDEPMSGLGNLFEEIHTDYEMLLKGVDEEIINKLSDLRVTLEKRAGFVVLRFDEDIKPRVLDAVSRSQADVISLHPLRKSLEGLFVEAAGRDDSKAI